MHWLSPLRAFLLLAPLAMLRAETPPAMIVEAGTGAVTQREILAFKQFMQTVPLPKDNLRNNMVYGTGGTAVEALARVFEISGDIELLDRMIAFADAMLAGRNDPKTGALIWTGERDLVWPNSVAKDGARVYAGSESGDVVGHIACTARLILKNKPLWETPVPGGDPHGFGRTYLDRAQTYVHEMDRTMDSFVVKYFVRPDTLRLYTPDSKDFEAASRPGAAAKGVPWNQQAMLINGFQRMAEAHTLLGDAPDRVRQYEAVVKASIDWFFTEVERCEVKGRPCYKWSYAAGEQPIKHYEDIAHGGYDIALFSRALQSGRYGLTPEMMLPFANTVTCILLQPGNKFVDHVSGIHTGKRPPGGISGYWSDLCEFDPTLYPILYEVNKARFKSGVDRTANFLWVRHQMQRSKVAR
jgi:hypothetical protein